MSGQLEEFHTQQNSTVMEFNFLSDKLCSVLKLNFRQ
jgi:hypothetical protein